MKNAWRSAVVMLPVLLLPIVVTQGDAYVPYKAGRVKARGRPHEHGEPCTRHNPQCQVYTNI